MTWIVCFECGEYADYDNRNEISCFEDVQDRHRSSMYIYDSTVKLNSVKDKVEKVTA